MSDTPAGAPSGTPTSPIPVQSAPDRDLPYDSPAVPGPPRAHVVLLSLGGTIFMTQDETGLRAAPDTSTGGDLARTLIDAVAITHEEIANVGSSSLQPYHLREVLVRARRAVDGGASGVVLTHGTDTLEESAFLLNRWWDRDQPLVLTGAMRPANAPGADGPGNLRDAVRTAAAPSARGLGVLAVFDAMVHPADRVTKTSSRSIDAFASEPSGPMALVGEEDLRLLYRPLGPSIQLEGIMPNSLPRVPTLIAGLGEDFSLLDDLPAGSIDGLVVAGVGMGHVAAPAVPRIARLIDSGVPVVVATRVATGGTSTRHYDYPGSEVDLIANGAVMAGALPPQKARLLLQVLLTVSADHDRIRAEFEAYAY